VARFLAWLDKAARHGGGYETPGSQVGAGLQSSPLVAPLYADPLTDRVAQYHERRITRTMTESAERAPWRVMKDLDGEEVERLLLHLYTGLPLLPSAEDGGRSAVLARFGPYEVRLTEFPPDRMPFTEFPPDRMPFLPLWVELIRDSGRELVDSCGFSEIEDAVDAVRELVEKARRLHDGS
jgi:hypothetical protein